MPGRFEFTPNRNAANYIYSAEKLMYLKGKKLHAKRNHINKFMLSHGNWAYEELNDENAREFFDYQLDWCADDPDEFLGETCAVSVALKNRSARKNAVAFGFACIYVAVYGYNRIHMTNHFLSDVCSGTLITYLIFSGIGVTFMKAVRSLEPSR